MKERKLLKELENCVKTMLFGVNLVLANIITVATSIAYANGLGQVALIWSINMLVFLCVAQLIQNTVIETWFGDYWNLTKQYRSNKEWEERIG